MSQALPKIVDEQPLTPYLVDKDGMPVREMTVDDYVSMSSGYDASKYYRDTIVEMNRAIKSMFVSMTRKDPPPYLSAPGMIDALVKSQQQVQEEVQRLGYKPGTPIAGIIEALEKAADDAQSRLREAEAALMVEARKVDDAHKLLARFTEGELGLNTKPVCYATPEALEKSKNVGMCYTLLKDGPTPSNTIPLFTAPQKPVVSPATTAAKKAADPDDIPLPMPGKWHWEKSTRKNIKPREWATTLTSDGSALMVQEPPRDGSQRWFWENRSAFGGVDSCGEEPTKRKAMKAAEKSIRYLYRIRRAKDGK